MTTTEAIEWHKGSTKPWPFQIKDRLGAALDCTGYTAKLYLRLVGSATLAIDGHDCAWVTQATGRGKYVWAGVGEPPAAGEYELQIKLDGALDDLFTYVRRLVILDSLG